MRTMTLILASLISLSLAACDDDDGSEADRRGVGAQCATTEDCTEEGQSCLTQFAGGYCGVENCTADVDCPDGSACVAHTDGTNYCFLICIEKIDCNRNRDVENEANCSSNIIFLENDVIRKACVPPSSGV